MSDISCKCTLVSAILFEIEKINRQMIKQKLSKLIKIKNILKIR